MRAGSVLWPERSAAIAEVVADGDTLTDLNIDQVIAAVLREGDEYGLESLFRRPVRDRDTVRYRQEVFGDLGNDAIRAVFVEFAHGMRRVRRRLAGAARLTHPRQKQRWLLDAAADYITAITRTAEAMTDLPLSSQALVRWRTFVEFYTGGAEFGQLVTAVRDVQQALSTVRYSIRIVDNTIEVGAATDEQNYSATIADLFVRFGSGAPPPPRPEAEWADMNQMEEQILDRVVALHPGAFRRLAEFSGRHEHFTDSGVATFDREIHFYLLYLDFARTITGDGRTMCLPQVVVQPADLRAEQAFDLALAGRRRHTEEPLVCNDFELSGTERVLVVTGPNQGGKTTFARMFGQLVYLAALGCPVPAHSARLALPDRICTHFERAEQAADSDGRLLAELERMRDTLDRATPDSVIILNESFSSTSTVDGVQIGFEVLDQIIARGSIAVWVTFFDELAHAGPATVSMVAATDSDDPSHRTFRIVRRPADGNAHAVVLAERYGLTYDLVTARIAQ
ncbi:MutS-related protein [Nocardia sp. NBC_01327]|uniref:MutS-related protein n=1 Tax=Nocardia sp. NBC_01327 TaxID=2903593 RepID=UPI002E11AC04|nr:DNA mismatch repair protein MutS [Nocardia sp. NBC_01327]